MPKLPRIWRPPGETLPRGKWRVQADFPLAALAFVWSFKTFTFMPLATAATWPLVVASVTLLLLVGIPLLFVETGIGQMTGYGSAMALRRMCPLLGGTGFVVILHAIIICMQYSVFGAWSLYYGFAMIREVVLHAPLAVIDTSGGTDDTAASTSMMDAGDWRLLHCDNDYNTDLCVKITDWNACNIHWLEVKSEEAMQESSDMALVTATVMDPTNDTTHSSWANSLQQAITSTIGPMLDRRARQHDDISGEDITAHHHGIHDGDDTSQHEHDSIINSARQRFLDANAFRRDYEDGRHCVASSEEYFTHYVLKISASLGDIGGPVTHLVPCILIVWILAFLAASKGTRTLAKPAWIVMISSMFILTAITLGSWSLLDLAVVDQDHGDDVSSSIAVPSTTTTTQQNATKLWFSDGIITGEKLHNSLFDISVWMQAAEFVLITILFGTGNLTTLASYNRRRHNLIRDVFVIGFGHLGVCLLVNANMTMWIEFVIHTARRRAGLQFDFHEWRDWTLLFIVSPLVIKRQAHAMLWAMLFYMMTFLVALSTLYTAVETLANFVQDEYLEHLRSRTTRVTGVVCILGFVLSLFFITRAGVFWLKLINHFINGTSLIIMLLIVVLVFIFGIERFKSGMRRSIYGTLRSSSSVNEMYNSIPARVGGQHNMRPTLMSTPSVIIANTTRTEKEDTRGRWFFTYFHCGCYASVVVIILTLLWILLINSPPLQYYGSGKPYPMWAKLGCLLVALGCLSPVVIYPIYCAFTWWPELRAQQQQESESQQTNLRPQMSWTSASSASINSPTRSARDGRLSTSNLRRGESEILRRLQLSSSPSTTAINSAGLTAGRTRHHSTPSRQLSVSESQGSPAAVAAAAAVAQHAQETDALLLPNSIGESKKQQTVTFFGGNIEDDSSSTRNGQTIQSGATEQQNGAADDEKKRVKFAAHPETATEVVVIEREEAATPPESTATLPVRRSKRKASIYSKLLEALITPHSYKLSIDDTGEEDDNVKHDIYSGGGYDDDDDDQDFSSSRRSRKYSKKQQQKYQNDFAIRLSSAREDEDDIVVVDSGRNSSSRNNHGKDATEPADSVHNADNSELHEHANLEFLNIPVHMTRSRRSSSTASSLMGTTNRLMAIHGHRRSRDKH